MYTDSVSNHLASKLIVEELRLKVLQENLAKNQATAGPYTCTSLKTQLEISFLSTSLLILYVSFLFVPVLLSHLCIINARTLLLAVGHCAGHEEMHRILIPDSRGL